MELVSAGSSEQLRIDPRRVKVVVLLVVVVLVLVLLLVFRASRKDVDPRRVRRWELVVAAVTDPLRCGTILGRPAWFDTDPPPPPPPPSTDPRRVGKSGMLEVDHRRPTSAKLPPTLLPRRCGKTGAKEVDPRRPNVTSEPRRLEILGRTKVLHSGRAASQRLVRMV